jgi:hypothetical protein
VLRGAGFAKVVLKKGETLVAGAKAGPDSSQGTEFNGNLLHFIH